MQQILAVTAGAPFDRLARSGSNYHLFTALDRRGILIDVVNARPKTIELLERISGYSPNLELKLQHRNSYTTPFSPLARRLMSIIGWYRARWVDSRPNVLLQIGAWYDLSCYPFLQPKLRANYQDANLAVFLRRHDLVLDKNSRSVRRALDWERRVYDQLDLIMTRSEWLRQSLVKDFGVNPSNVEVVGWVQILTRHQIQYHGSLISHVCYLLVRISTVRVVR